MQGGSSELRFADHVKQRFSGGTVILFTCAAKTDFPLVSVSPNVADILGFSPTYFLNNEHGWSGRIHKDDKQSVYQSFKKLLSQGGSAINEYRFKTRDGRYIWLRDEIKYVAGDEEAVIQGSSIDITERKKAEIALKENKEQYQSVVEHIKDVAYSLDDNGRLLFLNNAWEERTGFSISESEGKKFAEFVHPEDRANFMTQYRQLVDQNTEASTSVLRFLKKDGDFFWAEVFARKLEDETTAANVSGTVIDISEEIAQKQEREAANQRLEERVNQRSKELNAEIDRRKKAEEQLQQRLSYEQVISKCSSLLLENTSSEALRESLNILQQVTGCDRVYLYQNKECDGDLFMDLVMEETADGVESVSEITGGKFNYEEYSWWRDRLANQEIINAHVDDLPPPEKEILTEQRVESLLVIPIRVNHEWYGYVGFAHTRERRQWKENEVSLLKTAAGIIAAFEKRKQIEQSLVRQRNYTETILDSLPSIYLLMDEQLQFKQWNTEAERSTGYTGDELGGKDAYDLIAHEDYDQLNESMQRLRQEKGEGQELQLLTKSGEKISYFWKGYVIEFGEKKYFLCVGINITLQKETERELMSEKHFSDALVQSLPGIFYMIDSEGSYQRWNQNFEEQLGYSGDELEDMTPADFYTDEEYERVRSSIQKVFESGEAEMETEIVTKKGNKVPYYLTGKLFQRDGEQYLVGVGHDISERVKAREKLRKSEELFRNLFLKAPASIVMVGPDNKVKNVNESFEELFGYSEDELKGRDIDEVLVPEEEYEDAPKMPGENYMMDSFNKETRRLTKEGKPVDVFVAGIPVHVDGQPVAGFGMYIDITDQKRYEEEIYSSLKEKHVLLKEIHHRVKNNLAVVSGLLQLQMYETDDPMIKDTLRESESRIQTMALIHEKLYNSQNLARISCKSYIQDLVDTIRDTISTDKDITVHTQIADVELNINKAVPFALLVNEVVTNSFKHAFEGKEEGQISIRMEREDNDLRVHISDNGIGLPDEFAPSNSDTLGMTLINNFLKQLEADWEIDADNGTYVDLEFSVEDVRGSSDSGLVNL
ncbi:MAG: PAS domain S-box protein [Fodinibius sp.]|nr:PAS domain S-box protein [Fodinibius sp.]